MSLRNAIRAAALALAAIAVLAPTAANADLWWFDHDVGRFPLSTTEKPVAPYLDELIITDEKGAEIKGCVIFVEGQVYSKFGGMGEGSFTKKSEADECNSSIAGCKVTLEPLMNMAWGITLEEKEKTVTISNFSLTIKLGQNCAGLELPAESTVSGTITGKFANWEEPLPGRIVFDGKQSLTAGTKKIFLDGYIRFGTRLTALPEPKGFSATSSPAKVDGASAEFTVFTRASREVSCLGSTLSATPKNGDTTVSVTPTYEECTAEFFGLEYPATVKMNGCDYLFHLKSESTGGETYKFTATTDVKCPAGKEVEINVYNGHANHTTGTITCQIKLGEAGNQGLGLIQVTNMTPKVETPWMLAHGDVKEIDSKRTIGSILICGPEFDTAGTLESEYLLTGTTDPGGEANGIAVFP